MIQRVLPDEYKLLNNQEHVGLVEDAPNMQIETFKTKDVTK